MKRTIAFILITVLMLSILCGCNVTEKKQLEQGKSYDIVLEEGQNISLELVAITEDYLEIVITKSKTNGYFNLKTQTYLDVTTQLCDVAFVDPEHIIDYVMVNDSEKVESVDFVGGIQYGIPTGFAINSFEGSVNLKFYFYSNDTTEYTTLNIYNRKVRDYEITKVNETGNREIDSVIQTIALELK